MLAEAGSPLEVPNETGATPLITAARANHGTVAEYFIDHGASLTVQAKNGRTPLHFAVQGGITVTELLLRRGAFVNAADHKGSEFSL